jgi:D-glycero-D-manno-heptose 1,7-bisphosphate phosphatase
MNPSAGSLNALARRAVFLDRDGVINRDHHYVSRVEDFEILPGAIEAMGRLQQAGFRLILVTNQSGIGRGYYTLYDMQTVHRHLEAQMAKAGVSFTRIYYAPEAPDQPSRGRKPSPQFLFDARDEFGLDLSQCYFVGDKWIDVSCGWNAGVRRSVLVRTGYGAETEAEHREELARAVIVDDLAAAAAWIVKDAARPAPAPTKPSDVT